MTLRNDVQAVILPENLPQDYDGKINYKVIQLRMDGNPILRFGSKSEYHADIVRRTLEENQIPFCTDCEDVPERRGDRYMVVGAGRSRI